MFLSEHKCNSLIYLSRFNSLINFLHKAMKKICFFFCFHFYLVEFSPTGISDFLCKFYKEDFISQFGGLCQI